MEYKSSNKGYYGVQDYRTSMKFSSWEASLVLLAKQVDANRAIEGLRVFSTALRRSSVVACLYNDITPLSLPIRWEEYRATLLPWDEGLDADSTLSTENRTKRRIVLKENRQAMKESYEHSYEETRYQTTRLEQDNATALAILSQASPPKFHATMENDVANGSVTPKGYLDAMRIQFQVNTNLGPVGVCDAYKQLLGVTKGNWKSLWDLLNRLEAKRQVVQERSLQVYRTMCTESDETDSWSFIPHRLLNVLISEVLMNTASVPHVQSSGSLR